MERYAYLTLQDSDINENLEKRLSGFDVIVVNTGMSDAGVAEAVRRLPNAILLGYIAADIVPIDPAGGRWDYEKWFALNFPNEALWRHIADGTLVEGWPHTSRYSLTPRAIRFHIELVRDRILDRGLHGVYIDNFAPVMPVWFQAEYETAPVDINGDGVAETFYQAERFYNDQNAVLSWALRAAFPGAVIVGNVGTHREDRELNGICLESSFAPQKFRNALAVAHHPRLCIGWCENQMRLTSLRAVIAHNPDLEGKLLIGQYAEHLEIVPGSKA